MANTNCSRGLNCQYNDCEMKHPAERCIYDQCNNNKCKNWHPNGNYLKRKNSNNYSSNHSSNYSSNYSRNYSSSYQGKQSNSNSNRTLLKVDDRVDKMSDRIDEINYDVDDLYDRLETSDGIIKQLMKRLEDLESKSK